MKQKMLRGFARVRLSDVNTKKPVLERAFEPLGYTCQGDTGTFSLRRRTGGNLVVELALDVASDLPTGTRGLLFQVVFIDAEHGSPPSTNGMSLNVVPELKGSGLPAMVLAIVIVTVAAVVLYLWRTRWSRPSRARHGEG